MPEFPHQPRENCVLGSVANLCRYYGIDLDEAALFFLGHAFVTVQDRFRDLLYVGPPLNYHALLAKAGLRLEPVVSSGESFEAIASAAEALLRDHHPIVARFDHTLVKYNMAFAANPHVHFHYLVLCGFDSATHSFLISDCHLVGRRTEAYHGWVDADIVVRGVAQAGTWWHYIADYSPDALQEFDWREAVRSNLAQYRSARWPGYKIVGSAAVRMALDAAERGLRSSVPSAREELLQLIHCLRLYGYLHGRRYLKRYVRTELAAAIDANDARWKRALSVGMKLALTGSARYDGITELRTALRADDDLVEQLWSAVTEEPQ